MKTNPLTQADFYKTGHIFQYPKGTSLVFANFTPRSDKIAQQTGYKRGKIVNLGWTAFIKIFLIEQFKKEFFDLEKSEAINKYKERMDTALGEGAVPIAHIEELWEVGYLPIRIHALPEGAKVHPKVPVLTIYNTLPNFYWLVNYFETIISQYGWLISTSATIADNFYKLFQDYADETCDDRSFVPFQGHDFSMRGMAPYAATLSGFGHLAAGFIGTDTISAIDAAEDLYNANAKDELIGCSVPATEHSVACLNIQWELANGAKDLEEAEYRFLKRYITEIYPKGIVSYVTDTYDYWGVLNNILPKLKNEIMARDGKLVMRPDSGDPVHIIAGYRVFEADDKDSITNLNLYDITIRGFELIKWRGKYFKIYQSEDFLGDYHLETYVTNITDHEAKGSIQVLWEIFGGNVNTKGYKQLDPHIGLIYGDSINIKRAEDILQRLEEKGFASNNVVFGIGSFTYQYNTRDTFGWAVKATYGEVYNPECDIDVPVEIYKDPKTDNGTKKSAKGLIAVHLEDGEYVLKDQVSWACVHDEKNQLKTIFENGMLLIDPSLKEIRERIAEERNR